MSKIIFKIVDKIAKMYNMTLLDIFVEYCIFSSNGEVEKIFEKFDEKENEVLLQFFEYLDEDSKNVSEMVVEYIDDFDKASEVLSYYFLNFISKEAVKSKNPDKIRESLKIYPDEIRDAILKSLEMLSAVKLLDEDKKRVIITEIINTILILSKILKVLNETK